MNINHYKEYISAETMMGPSSVRILEELFDKYPLQLASDDCILDLGCGKGLTSLVIAKETGARIYVNDLWVSAEENEERFAEWGLGGQVTPICLKIQSSGKRSLAVMIGLKWWKHGKWTALKKHGMNGLQLIMSLHRVISSTLKGLSSHILVLLVSISS